MNAIMKNKKVVVITSLLCLVPIVFGIIMWKNLPDRMPTHFGLDNEPNGYMSKAVAVFILPLILVALELFCLFASSLDPKKSNISAKSLLPVLWMMPGLSWVLSAVMYASALGHKPNVGAIVIAFLGIVFMLLGNFLPKSAKNYTFGAKTPWALNDESNWNYTSRIASKSFVLSGLAMIIIGIISLILSKSIFLYCLAAAAIAATLLIPLIASYKFYQKNKVTK